MVGLIQLRCCKDKDIKALREYAGSDWAVTNITAAFSPRAIAKRRWFWAVLNETEEIRKKIDEWENPRPRPICKRMLAAKKKEAVNRKRKLTEVPVQDEVKLKKSKWDVTFEGTFQTIAEPDVDSNDETVGTRTYKFGGKERVDDSRKRLLALKTPLQISALYESLHQLKDDGSKFRTGMLVGAIERVKLKCLMKDTYLNNYVINAIAGGINNMYTRNKAFCFNTNAMFTDKAKSIEKARVLEELYESSLKNQSLTLKPSNLFKNDILLFPLHITEVHWVLAFYRPKSRTLFIVDTIQRRPDYYGKNNVVKRLIRCLKVSHKVDEAKEISCKLYKGILTQTDNDCGVFTCAFAILIVRGINLHTCRESDGVFLRKMLLQSMVKGHIVIK